MANMDITTRTQIDRVELGVVNYGVRLRGYRGLYIYAAISTLILGALAYAAAEAISGWASVVVLAMICVNVVGLMIAISPRRRG